MPYSPYYFRNRSEYSMDPLSDVLSLVRLGHYRSGGFEAGGNWAVEFPADESFRFYALLSGTCWLSTAGIPSPVRVVEGDCLLFPTGQAFLLGSDLTLPAANALTLFSAENDGRLTTYQGGGDLVGIGGYFTLAGDQARILLEQLPSFFHLREASDKTVLRWTLERLRQELIDPQPGGFLIAQQLTTMVLVEALRLHLLDGTTRGVGWLYALADKRISQALTALHQNPAHRWTVRSLGECAGMSRTSFALRFKALVGQSPLDYLTHWRMGLAGNKLIQTDEPLWGIAESLGYESESAFSTAFKRVMGCSPRQYGGRARHSAPVSPG